MAGVLTDIVTIDSLDNYDLIPPVGQDLEVTDIGASIIAGAGLAGVPQVLVGVFDGVAGLAANFRRSSAAAPSIRGWDKPPKWFINPTNYLRINNPDVALPVNVAISYKIAADYGPNGVSKVISDVLDMDAGDVWEVRPPAGQDWNIRDIATSRWSAGAGGLPNVTVELTDGVSFATIAIGTENFGWHSFDIHINHDVWLRLTNPAAGALTATVGFSGIISKDYGPNGVSEVASLVGTVLGGAANILLVRPPIGQEWKVTRIGGSVLTAAAPLSLPDVVAALTDAAPIVSPVLQGTEDKGWFDDLEIYLNHDNWMTITDTPAAGADLGVSAFITEA